MYAVWFSHRESDGIQWDSMGSNGKNINKDKSKMEQLAIT